MEEKKSALGEGISNCAQWLIALVSFLAFAFFAVVGFFSTCHVDFGFSADNNEHVSFLIDNILLNVAVLVVLIAISIFLMRKQIKRKTVLWVSGIIFFLSTAIGIWWVVVSKSIPSWDSGYIYDTARQFAQGSNHYLTQINYFKIYPFQTGDMFYTEILMRVLGTDQTLVLQIVNVLLAAAGNVAILLLAGVLFDDTRIELLTAILLGLCLQPMLTSTFLYGSVPGMAFALWGLLFVALAIRKGRFIWLIPGIACVAIAVMIKLNFTIVYIAAGILLVIYAIRKKRPAFVLGAALLIAVSLLLPYGVRKQYEARAETNLGKGTPQTAWLVTGLRDSMMCAGWYNGYTDKVLVQNDFDYEKTLAQCKTDAQERIDIFLSRPIYLASFFYHKVVSQWNEPSYESVWISASGARSGEVSEFVQSIGTGEAEKAVMQYLNQLMQYVYGAMAVAFFVFFRKKDERREERMIIPLILLGAILYHALFEAKSQYAVIYVPMMAPYAAYGMKKLSEVRLPIKKGLTGEKMR
ncbi:MAG: hypothetical protein VB034_06550 [Eubacteriales bacterium]|nr:hypothetical protein [Eubacteriales bacterium]